MLHFRPPSERNDLSLRHFSSCKSMWEFLWMSWLKSIKQNWHTREDFSGTSGRIVSGVWLQIFKCLYVIFGRNSKHWWHCSKSFWSEEVPSFTFSWFSSCFIFDHEEIQEIRQNWVPNWAERKMATILFTFRNENELSSQPLTTLISEMDAKTRKLKILFDGKQQV